MLRTAHMKACVNQLGFLRYPATLSRSSGVLRGDDASEHTRHVCISTRHPLTHMTVSGITWTHTPHTLFLFQHGSDLPPRSRVQKWERCPESGVKRQTCCFRWLAGVGSGRWMKRFKSASRSAVQTRGLHRRSVTDECLSAGNEARCRRSLQANGALYGQGGGSWAAVLVCLCAVSGDPALLFTLRSAQLKGRHKGDVSFAGGKKDPSDGSVVDTALREAREELGIHVTEEKVWGVMKPLRDLSGMIIAPVIANLGPLETLSFRPNPSEVEEIFTLTLEHLCQAQNRGYTHFRIGDRYGYTVPVFHSPKYRIWGLTAVALDHALKLIVPPKTLLDRSTFNTEAAC